MGSEIVDGGVVDEPVGDGLDQADLALGAVTEAILALDSLSWFGLRLRSVSLGRVCAQIYREITEYCQELVCKVSPGNLLEGFCASHSFCCIYQ